MEEQENKPDSKTESPKSEQPEEQTQKEDVFSIKEIDIEEMAIDGICGVY